MVGASDAMLKSADVQLASYEIIGDGLCTAIIRGSVANVAVAIEAGINEAEKIGELHAVMIIPKLLQDLEHTLPIDSYWLEKPEPLPILMPDTVREKQRELVALPELEKPAINRKILQKEPEIIETKVIREEEP